MSDGRQFRNYLYVSKRKVGRMAPAVPPVLAKGVAGFHVKAGPIGAGLQFHAPEAANAIAGVAEVEAQIRARYGVRTLADQDIRPGHWVEGVGIQMTYGVPAINTVPTEAAVFVAVQDAQRMFFAGSASNLLDHDAPLADPAGSMSAPGSIWTLLLNCATPADLEAAEPLEQAQDGYPIVNVHDALVDAAGLFPLSFLAFITRTTYDHDGTRNLIGTPLYVAAANPW